MTTRSALRRPGPVAVLAGLLLVAVACDYDPNAPGRMGGGRGSGGGGTVDMSGEWTYESELFLTGQGLRCSIEGATFTLEQSDSTFSGSYSRATLVCSATGLPPDTLLRAGFGAVVDGRVRGDSVFFNIDGSSFRHAGRRSGTTVSGTAVMFLDDRTLTGTFTLAKP